MRPLRGKAVRALRTLILAVLCLGWVGTAGALADGPVGPNPPSNFPIGQLPLACQSGPTSTACINAGVYWLDQARATLHQGSYELPSDFASLSPDKQVFILVNLDRIQYGLLPITGLTRELDGFALTGVRQDRDPESTDPNFDADGNWAGAYTNMVVAYEEWMYDDGLGSTNLDCSPSHQSGCWGHRQDVLWDFTDESGPYAMGAAAGRDTSGKLGYTTLLGRGNALYDPVYYYTWAQAVAAGAGTNSYVVQAPARLQALVRAQGRTLRIDISAPAHTRVECQLSLRSHGRWQPEGRFYVCGSGVTTYRKVSPGRYRVQVKAVGMTVTDYVTVK
jgi:hypothetical protein